MEQDPDSLLGTVCGARSPGPTIPMSLADEGDSQRTCQCSGLWNRHSSS